MEKLFTAQEAAEKVGLSYDYFRRVYCDPQYGFRRGDKEKPQSWRYRFTGKQIDYIIKERWQLAN